MKKRIVSMLLAVALCVGLTPLPVAAETLDGDFIIEGGILVRYEGEGGDIVLPDGIIGIKTSAFQGHEEITGVVIPEGVTEIPDQAFYKCGNLTSVTIPDGVTYIGHNAFSQTGLTSVVIPDSVEAIPEAFRDCKNLKSVSLGRGLTEITAYAFQGAGLTEVVIPDNVTSIGNRAFAFCDELTSITIPASVRKIGDSAFAQRAGENSYSTRNDILTVRCEENSAASAYAERNATAVLGTFDADGNFIPGKEEPSPSEEPVESEKPSPSATPSQTPKPSPSATPAQTPKPSPSATPAQTTKPSSGTTSSGGGGGGGGGSTSTPTPTPSQRPDFEIDENGVLKEYWGTATDVVIPEGVTAIRNGAFISRGNSIVSVTTPDSMKSIGEHAFSSCPNLERVKFGSGVTEIRDGAFWGCTGLTEIVIPDTVKTIGKDAFYECKNLSRVDLGHGVTTIGNSAFRECGSLTEIVIPDNVKTIGDYAFYECKNLSHVDLGHGVTTIGDSAFRDCHKLTEIIIPDNVTKLGYQAFSRSDSAALIGIKGSLGGAAEDYIRSTWINGNSEIFIPGTFVNGEFVPDGKEYDLETYVKQEQMKADRERVIEQAKGYEYYQDYLQANRELIDSIEECDYAYTWIPDDIQALSDQLCEGLTSDYDRVLALHDWVTENIYYSYPALKDYTLRHDNIQEAYDNRNCVCVGYSNLMQSLCWAQGIPAVHVSGIADGAHAWNVINIDGEWLWMDATWDTYNSYDGPGSWSKGNTRLLYCLCSTEFISTDHKARCTTAYEGENITTATYYALYYPAKYPDTKSLAIFGGGLDDATVKEINTIRAKAGLPPVTTGTTWGSLFGLYYQPPEDTKTEQTSAVETAMTSEERHKQQDEELEKEYQEDMKKYFLNDTSLSPWAKDEVARAVENKLVPQALLSQYNTDITRAEFCQLMMQMVETAVGTSGKTYIASKGLTYGDHPFTDVSRYSSYADSVTCAYVLGIVKGTSETTFNPSGKITRQEAATMLARTAKVLGITAGQSVDFADADSFADWGREGIAFISGVTDPYSGKKVMEGTGEGNFSPTATYSREQAIITALRLFSASGKQTIR